MMEGRDICSEHDKGPELRSRVNRTVGILVSQRDQRNKCGPNVSLFVL